MTMGPTNPWHHAKKDDRKYITPEDVTAAIDAGGTKLEVWEAVLDGVAKRAVEDPRCTAFVALKFEKSPPSESP